VSQKSIGLIEAIGLCAGITAADAAVKTANVKLLGYEYSKGDGMTVVKVEGDVAACKAAVAAGSKAAEPHGGVKCAIVIPRPANGIIPIFIKNKENVGGEYHLATGKRPKGQSAGPVLVKRNIPVAPAVEKVEEPVEDETPIETPVETPVEETPVETPVEEIIEETPVEEPVAEEPVQEEAVVEEVEEAPVKEDPVEAAVEEVEEIPVEEPAAEIDEEVTEEEAETPAEEPTEDKPAEDGLVVKSTSRGRRGGRKAKGNSSKKDK
jgi:microcompartment protein CcmL/EutN